LPVVARTRACVPSQPPTGFCVNPYTNVLFVAVAAALAVAAASLPLGTAAYVAALYYGGDRTLRSLLGIVRAYAARGTNLITGDNTPHSSKAPPPAPKIE